MRPIEPHLVLVWQRPAIVSHCISMETLLSSATCCLPVHSTEQNRRTGCALWSILRTFYADEAWADASQGDLHDRAERAMGQLRLVPARHNGLRHCHLAREEDLLRVSAVLSCCVAVLADVSHA